MKDVAYNIQQLVQHSGNPADHKCGNVDGEFFLEIPDSRLIQQKFRIKDQEKKKNKL